MPPEEMMAQTQMKNCTITIIVCSYNRAEILQECLQSLAKQTAPPSRYEVLIVDNNSSDTTPLLCRTFTQPYAHFRYITEPRQGLSHARNRGWREAETEWVAYIDDDARASGNYVERILHVIEQHEFDCFGGIYTPWYRYAKPRWFRDEYASNMNVQDHTGPLASGYVSGGNLIIRRTLLEEFKGFNPNLGMRPGKIAYGEETLLQMQLRVAGYTIGFDPQLTIEHLVGREKLSPWWFVKSSYARNRDHTRCMSASSSRTLVQTIKSVIHDLLFYTGRATPQMFSNRYYWQNWIIEVFSPTASHIGSFIGTLQYRIKE